MTGLKDKQPAAIAHKHSRSTESPRFWLMLGGGSIALHLLLLLGLRWMNFRATVASTNSDPTPIEMVELAPAATGSEAIAPAPAVIAPAPAAPAAPPPAPAIPEIAVPPPEFTAPPLQPPAPTPQPRPESSPPTPQPQPALTPSPLPTPQPDRSPLPTPPPQPNRSPTAPPQPIDRPAASPPSEPPPEQPTGSPNSQEPNLNQPPQLPPAPPIDSGSHNGSTDAGGTDDGLGSVDVESEVAPARYVATISASAVPPEAGRDIPQNNQFPQPIAAQRDFTNDSNSSSSCSPVTPDLFGFLGAPVQFRVIVDADPNNPSVGKVSSSPGSLTPLNGGSGNVDYDNLASCQLRDWEFRMPDTDAVVEAPSSEVIVTVQINRE